MPGRTLDTRTLNRTLLLRQGLLERSDTPPLEMIERLAGLQAQVPSNPYVALWARLRDFRPEQLSELIASRRAVRAGLMRSTLHLVSARDYLTLAPLTAPLRARAFRSPFAAGLDGTDLEAVVRTARELLAHGPLTSAQLGERLAPRFPGAQRASLAYAATLHLPLVQIPPRGVWKQSMQATWALAEPFLGATLDDAATMDGFLLRYLAAFGPATSSDVRTWCGVSGLRAVIERLRPRLRTYRDERGRELFDVEDGVLADPDVPAPVRFLPEYDNVWLSHADRSRIVDERGPGAPYPDGTWIGGLLVDGYVRGYWKVTGGEAALDRFRPAPGDPSGAADAIAAEGARLVEFLALP